MRSSTCLLTLTLVLVACGPDEGETEETSTGAGGTAATGGSASTTGASTAGAGGGATGGGTEAGGFTPEPGFSTSGSVADGGTLTLESDAAVFGAKPFDGPPLLW